MRFSHFQLILPINTNKHEPLNYAFLNQSTHADSLILPRFQQPRRFMRQYALLSECFPTFTSAVLSAFPTITYLLNPLCWFLLEKLTGLQLVKKFPAFHVTRRFITALTSVRHLSLSWASPIQSIYPHPTSWRSILILSTYLRLGLPSGNFPPGFPTKTLYTPLSSPIRATCPAHFPTVT